MPEQSRTEYAVLCNDGDLMPVKSERQAWNLARLPSMAKYEPVVVSRTICVSGWSAVTGKEQQ